MTWHWLERADIEKVLAATTGRTSTFTVRDEGALASALQAPKSLAASAGIDVFALAASYASEILHRSPLDSGNAEASVAVAEAFLECNGQVVTMSPDIRSSIADALVAGDIDEAGVAAWLRRHASPPSASFLVPEQDG